MIDRTDVESISDFTLPKQVWAVFSTLKRGYGCEFLTTNMTQKSVNKISLFKYLDEAVRIKLTVTPLMIEAEDQPRHILIEGINKSENNPQQKDLVQRKGEARSNAKDMLSDSMNNESVYKHNNALCEKQEEIETEECETLILDLDDPATEQSHSVENGEDGTTIDAQRILVQLDKSAPEIVTVTEALEAYGNLGNINEMVEYTAQNEAEAKVDEEENSNSNNDNTSDDEHSGYATEALHENECVPTCEIIKTEEDSPVAEQNCKIRIGSEVKVKANVCPVCKKKYRSNYNLYRHVRKEHRDLQRSELISILSQLQQIMKEKCKICGKVYANIHILKGHMEVMHAEHEQAMCPMCGIKVKNEKCLAGHMKRIHHSTEKKYLCHLCPASFSVQNYLNGHLNTVHTNKPKDFFKCEMCDFKSASERYVRLHKGRVHGERKFECTCCGMKFTSSSNLKRHMDNIHKDMKEKPFICAICDKGFTTKANLKTHEDTIHCKKLSLNCNHCNVVFRRRSDLASHVARSACRKNQHTIPDISVLGMETVYKEGYILLATKPSS